MTFRYLVYLPGWRERGEEPFAAFTWHAQTVHYREHCACVVWDTELNEYC